MPGKLRATALSNSMTAVKSNVNIQLHFKMFVSEGSVLSPAYNFTRSKIYSLCLQAILRSTGEERNRR